MAAGPDVAGEIRIVVVGGELNVADGPAGPGQVLIDLVEVAAVEGDGAAGGHPVDHLVLLLPVLVDDDAQGAVVGGVAVMIPHGYGQLVPHVRPGVRPEAEGIQGIGPEALVAGVKVVPVQIALAEGAGAGVEHAVEIVIVVSAGDKGDVTQGAAVIAELFVGLLKPGQPQVHLAAGGHPEDDVGGVGGDRRAGEGDDAGDLIAVSVLGSVGQGQAAGGAGNKVDVLGKLVICIAVPQGILSAVVGDLSITADVGEIDGGEAAVAGQGVEQVADLGEDLRARVFAAGGAHGDGEVPSLVGGGRIAGVFRHHFAANGAPPGQGAVLVADFHKVMDVRLRDDAHLGGAAFAANMNLPALGSAGGRPVNQPVSPGVAAIRQGGGREARQHDQRQEKRRQLFLPKIVHTITSVPAENGWSRLHNTAPYTIAESLSVVMNKL